MDRSLEIFLVCEITPNQFDILQIWLNVIRIHLQFIKNLNPISVGQEMIDKVGADKPASSQNQTPVGRFQPHHDPFHLPWIQAPQVNCSYLASIPPQ
jgi:hypothetical protein